ncbi:MAG TPA: CoA pyrophosphatase [Rhodobacteraceae bacterium]|nr:CoA pyrophosphatase [Paracoccaceae bacterium]
MIPNETRTTITAALGRLHQGSSDFDLNPDTQLDPMRTLRPAAVLVALQQVGGEIHVVLTKRASHLKHHAGQISFPGGKQEESDNSLEQTALREAEEEIGLPPQNVEILGSMPTHETVTNFTVTPVLGLIRATFNPTPDYNEVAEVFTVPLSHVTNTARFSVQGRRWRGQRRAYYTVPYGPYYIWGATARILRVLAEGMNP